MVIEDEATVYHVMSRTALDGFVIGDIEKDFMLNLVKRYSELYFVEILGFCLMGNHFHILVKMLPEYKFIDEDLKKRYLGFYGDDRVFTDGLIPSLKAKLSSLSEFVREIKVGFTRYYNKRYNRRGYFWGDRKRKKGTFEKKGDVRAESALQLSSFVRFDIYAKISKVRYAWNFAPCHGPGYRTKRDIF